MTAPLLEVRNLGTAFRTEGRLVRAVDGISFRVERGETLGIVGESGSGKSVTALSLMRLLPRGGSEILPGSSVLLRGRELLALSDAEMRAVRGNEMAMVFQEPMTSLNPVLTVEAQVAEALRAHRAVRGAAVRERVLDLLRRVGIADPERRRKALPHELSGGMRQRVMIAMALACEPAVLIADEPTTALDVTIQAQILALLVALQAELGMAMILISHDLGVVAEVADRVAVMYAGRLVERGSVERVFACPRHPYTEGLLRALPDIDRPDLPLVGIAGSVPKPTAWPSGCRFHPRCPHTRDRCVREEPPWFEAGVGAVRCWLAEEP